MDDKFLQQLKKGVLEMLVLEVICQGPTYGYALMTQLKSRTNGLFTLKEGTLYPILYRLEDDSMIQSCWSSPEGRTAPKKMYSVTQAGLQTQQERTQIWMGFVENVNDFLKGSNS